MRTWYQTNGGKTSKRFANVKLRGLVAFGPRQSVSSFVHSLGEFKKNDIFLDLKAFHPRASGKSFRSACRDGILIWKVLFGRYDFVILSSGATLFSRPTLLRCIILICRSRGLKTFVIWHNEGGRFQKLKNKLGAKRFETTRNIFRSSHIRHLAVSNMTSREVVENLGITRADCVYNCVRDPGSSVEHTPPDEPPVVLAVAKLNNRKNPADFMRIASLVCRDQPETRFVWLGAESSKQLDEMALDFGIEKNVKFVSFDPDPYKYYLRASVLLLTSTEEAFGLVVAEAMASARTPICYSGTGAAEIVGRFGSVVPQGDIHAAADVIKSIIDCPPHCRINLESRRAYHRMFEPGVYAARLCGLIRDEFEAVASEVSS